MATQTPQPADNTLPADDFAPRVGSLRELNIYGTRTGRIWSTDKANSNVPKSAD